MTNGGHKAKILEAVRDALEALEGHVVEPVTVIICSGGETKMRLSSGLSKLPPMLQVAIRNNKLSRIDKKILEVAARAPLTAKRLANLAGYQMNSHFSASLRTLVRRELLVHTADGYHLPAV